MWTHIREWKYKFGFISTEPSSPNLLIRVLDLLSIVWILADYIIRTSEEKEHLVSNEMYIIIII